MIQYSSSINFLIVVVTVLYYLDQLFTDSEFLNLVLPELGPKSAGCPTMGHDQGQNKLDEVMLDIHFVSSTVLN